MSVVVAAPPTAVVTPPVPDCATDTKIVNSFSLTLTLSLSRSMFWYNCSTYCLRRKGTLALGSSRVCVPVVATDADAAGGFWLVPNANKHSLVIDLLWREAGR